MTGKFISWSGISLFVIIPALLLAQESPAPPVPEPQTQPPPAAPVEPSLAPRPMPQPPERRLLPTPTARSGDMVSLNFNRADLIEVIHVLAQHLKLTYIIDPEVKGMVTIYSSEPLKKEDLLPIFHQVLRMNGAVAIKTRDLYRISAIKDAKGLASPASLVGEDGFVLQVVPVRFFSVGEMKKLLAPFVTPGGEILDYPRGNFLIIADLASNIQRLMEIRDLIDVSVFSGTRMEIYQPKVASAEELATEMTKIMQTYASSAPQAEGFAAQFIPLPRINQLLIIGHSEAAWTYVQRWLDRVDVIGEGPGRRIFIYPVENGKATELADILSQALGQPSPGRREPAKTLQDLHRGDPSATGVAGTVRPPMSGSGGSSTGNLGVPGAFAVVPVPPEAPRSAPAAPSGVVSPPPPSATAKPQEQLRIVADPATNSLIIYSTAQEFQNIRNILKELDVVPRQVLMDVLVAEISMKDDLSFGIEYEIMKRAGVSIFGQTFGSEGAVRSGILPAPSAVAGALTQYGTGLSGVAGRSNAVRAFINTLMTDSRVKILFAPSILASDNRPARIQVGSEVPVLTSQQVTATTTGVLVNNVQYRNTGVILTIIPQVNSLGLVHLQVKQEVSDIGLQSFGDTGSPSFTTRDAETTAIVQNNETLVIGGIISERKSRDRTGIPFLMNIPVLGHFFGTTKDAADRTELVMLITPHVIRNKEESRVVTEEFKDKLSIIAREIDKLKAPASAGTSPEAR